MRHTGLEMPGATSALVPGLRYCRTRALCTQEELYNKLKGIDLEDGQADGRAPLP